MSEDKVIPSDIVSRLGKAKLHPKYRMRGDYRIELLCASKQVMDFNYSGAAAFLNKAEQTLQAIECLELLRDPRVIEAIGEDKVFQLCTQVCEKVEVESVFEFLASLELPRTESA